MGAGSVQSQNNWENDNIDDDDIVMPVRPAMLGQTEDVYWYEPGGYHPIHLGDELDEGNYVILHKLGHGSLSTVWLARDKRSGRHVAIKVLVATASGETYFKQLGIRKHLEQGSTTHPIQKRLCFLMEKFSIIGPNGTHLCLVYPVAGLSIGQLWEFNKRLRGRVVRNVSRQLTETVAYLHSQGVCHGDLTISKLTLQLRDFDAWTTDDIITRLGTPKVEHIKSRTDRPIPKRYPKYLVQSLDLSRINPKYLSQELCLIDFGEAFLAEIPPDKLAAAVVYRSPSDWFGEAPGKGSDLWALACTIYCMRASIDLFDNPFFALGSAESIDRITRFLGPLPARWDNPYFDTSSVARSRCEIDASMIREPCRDRMDDCLKPWQRLLSITSWIRDDYHGPMRKIDKQWASADPDWRPWDAEIPMPKDEAVALSDLFTKLFRYEADQRTPAEELVDHAWFTGDFNDHPCAEDAGPLFQSNYPPFNIWEEFKG